jgi:hypothetical protein
VSRPRFNPRLENLEDRLAPATFTVTTLANGGAGSLRQAILDANSPANPGADIIDFNLPGTGVQQIKLKTALPSITEQVTIDGTTQAGFTAKPIVVLNGNATTSANGLVVAVGADNSIIRGLVIQRFDLHGIVLQSNGNTVDTCFIGTNAAGSAAAGNGGSGIAMLGTASGNTIGGAGGTDISIGGAQNLISGNGGHGILMKGAGVTTNLVRGNFIGTTAVADTEGFFGSIPNAFNGVNINQGANNNTVGDANQLINFITFIAGNNGQGINIAGAGTSTNTVVHTTVGSNLGSGIRIQGAASNNTIGGSAEGEANIVSFNQGNGVLISGSGTTGNTVLGNLIGVDQDGLVGLGNVNNGVTINKGASGNTIGGTAQFEGNVISDNGKNGVNINGVGTNGNTVAGNIIGADATGTVDLGNTLSGIQIAGGAKGNIIGGTTTDAPNLISGNNKHGILLKSAGTKGNTIIGNIIGTNLAGTSGLANGKDGINIGAGANANVIGGSGAGERNTISGNGRVGIVVQANQTVIQGNQIGTTLDGLGALANSSHGIIVTNKASNTLIGGTLAGEGNVIANNGAVGVLIGRDATFPTPAGSGNAVLGNSIFSNALLGIRLNGGANHKQTFPTINSATIVNLGTQLDVNFQLTSKPSTQFRIEIFASPSADPLGFGEGKTFLGFIDVTTDASGTVTQTATVNWTITDGLFITATATNLSTNDSSSFSAAQTAT